MTFTTERIAVVSPGFSFFYETLKVYYSHNKVTPFLSMLQSFDSLTWIIIGVSYLLFSVFIFYCFGRKHLLSLITWSKAFLAQPFEESLLHQVRFAQHCLQIKNQTIVIFLGKKVKIFTDVHLLYLWRIHLLVLYWPFHQSTCCSIQ